jgi:spore coat polysaccharide biosynthesis protein SpsF
MTQRTQPAPRDSACIVVLQARTSSSRLPAKVLLPVGGLPLAVLAAKRAGNTGRKVVVATSTRWEDDALVRALEQHGVACHRGSLDNVLERMVSAAAGLPDETLFVRLTADNVFPDGSLIDEMERDFLARGLDYLACNGEPSGLPHGASCEITRLGHLRDALRNATQPSDLEHVTPIVIRRFGPHWFTKYLELGMGHFRCTVDSHDDYAVVEGVFAAVSDPIHATMLQLVERLRQAKYQPAGARPVPRLVLGTAQLGMRYGIANDRGMPSRDESQAIVKNAIANGVAWIDTANAYGESEARLGDILSTGWHSRVQVVTKLSPLADCGTQAGAGEVAARVDASVHQSCARLRVRRLDALLLHRAAHLHAWDGAAWKRLRKLREDGVIGTLGVSVQDPEELRMALEFEEVGLVQMPFNILDGRWSSVRERILSRKAAHPLLVHVRSTLLQGLLGSADAARWRRAHVPDPGPVLRWLEGQKLENGCTDVLDLCLRYARSQSWIDGVVVGVETEDQLRANLASFQPPALHPDAVAAIERTRPALADATLDPARWGKDQ